MHSTRLILGAAILAPEGGEVMAVVQDGDAGGTSLHGAAGYDLCSSDDGRGAKRPVRKAGAAFLA